ncbi:hypothetical protein ACIQPT_22035 [Streptomyces sp. NPDC091289]|uniref:hypothetical protein n=1 Tax=Streptomyces sp. NPDC091289 TaxID=3365989 RepID=UPI0037F4D2D5
MRPSQDPSGGVSPTPIYDALYSEYRRSFRALPGDRSGEENLGFPAFGAGLFASRAPLSGHPASSGHSGHSSHGSHGGHNGQSGSSGQSASSGSGGSSGQSQHTGSLGSWQRVGRHAGRPRPAALPPGSRDS